MKHAGKFVLPAKLTLPVFHDRWLALALHALRIATRGESGARSCEQETTDGRIVFEIANEHAPLANWTDRCW